MLLLTSTSDLIQLVTDSTAAVKVHASYVDNNAGSITPGRLNTAISTATTTTIAGAPGASIQRSVRAILIQNSDASTTSNVTVQHTDGTTVVNLFKAQLLAGETLEFIDGQGWTAFSSGGVIKQFAVATLPAPTTTTPSFRATSGTLETSPSAGDFEYDGVVSYFTPVASERGVLLCEQFICSTATFTLTSQTAAQKMFNSPTNGQVTVGGNRTYEFECFYTLSSMSSTSGSFGFALAGTATFTSLAWTASAVKAAAGTGVAGSVGFATTTAMTTIAVASTATTGSAWCSGILRVNAGGTIIPQVSLGVAAAAIVGVNSFFRIRPLGTGGIISVGNWS